MRERNPWKFWFLSSSTSLLSFLAAIIAYCCLWVLVDYVERHESRWIDVKLYLRWFFDFSSEICENFACFDFRVSVFCSMTHLLMPVARSCLAVWHFSPFTTSFVFFYCMFSVCKLAQEWKNSKVNFSHGKLKLDFEEFGRTHVA